MAISWYPLQNGQVLTAAMINELIAAIQNGSIFTSVAFVNDLVTSLDARVAAVEANLTILNQTQATIQIWEQFTMSAGQDTIQLAHTPVLDSEFVFMNGMKLSKSGIPIGFSADYSISGSTITLVPELALQIAAGDICAVNYRYGA